jgi:hypothetical protein
MFRGKLHLLPARRSATGGRRSALKFNARGVARNLRMTLASGIHTGWQTGVTIQPKSYTYCVSIFRSSAL